MQEENGLVDLVAICSAVGQPCPSFGEPISDDAQEAPFTQLCPQCGEGITPPTYQKRTFSQANLSLESVHHDKTFDMPVQCRGGHVLLAAVSAQPHFRRLAALHDPKGHSDQRPCPDSAVSSSCDATAASCAFCLPALASAAGRAKYRAFTNASSCAASGLRTRNTHSAPQSTACHCIWVLTLLRLGPWRRQCCQWRLRPEARAPSGTTLASRLP